MKIRPVGAELFRAGKTTDRWTDDEVSSCFSQSCERAYKRSYNPTRVFECFETFRDEREDLEVDPSTSATLDQKTLKISCELWAKDSQMT
jgi:hypothetical protein